MKLTPYTQGLAEEYRTAKAVYLAPTPQPRTAEQLTQAREVYRLAAEAFATAMLADIDEQQSKIEAAPTVEETQK